MDIICSPRGIVDAKHPGQGMMDLARAGFTDILLDLSAVCTGHELENVGKPKKQAAPAGERPVSEHPEELYHALKPMLEKCRREGLSFQAVRAPYLHRDTKRGDLNGLMKQLAEESIRVCRETGCKYLIVRPLSAGIPRGEEWETNRKFYLGLAALAKESRIMILLENQCRDWNGHLLRGICADGEEAAAWVDRLNEEAGEEAFGFCMDTGVCSLCGQNMQEFARSVGKKRLKAVVLRDCNGSRENAMLPFTCVDRGSPQTDWLGLVRGLREACFDGLLILDIADTAASFSPILRLQLMQLAKATAEYFKWQIEMEGRLKKHAAVVLFGAGNMCRNYMKCYGESCPPLFTCDNNRALWDTDFCGLKVKAPESLKELPKDCAILICNIYYREIEQQLREMGIENPIEFFNDEYMPSFYFDRVEDISPR